MKNRIIICGIVVTLMTLGLYGCGKTGVDVSELADLLNDVSETGNMTSDSETETEAEELSQEVSEEPVADDAFTGLEIPSESELGIEYAVVIDGKRYDFPLALKSFMDDGWSFTDDTSMHVNAGNYGNVYYLEKDGEQFVGVVENLSENQANVLDCALIGFQIKGSTNVKVEFPNGVTYGESSYDDVVAAFGEPTSVSDNNPKVRIEYREKALNYVSFTFFDGVMSEMAIQYVRFDNPNQTISPKNEVPEIVKAYKQPNSVSDNFSDYSFSIDGAVYRLPSPVSAFTANGWSIDTENSDEALANGSTGTVKLTKGEYTLSCYAENYDVYSAFIENCFIYDINIIGYYGETVDLRLPKGLKFRDNRKTVEKALEGTSYDTSEGSNDSVYFFVEDDNSEGVKNGYTIYLSDTGLASVEIVYQPDFDSFRKELGLN